MKTSVGSQFLAAIEMLEGSIDACPDYLWSDDSGRPPCWRLAFHTLFWLDLYLTGTDEGFQPPKPFGLEELDPSGKAPPRTYSKEELLEYLAHCRRKCETAIETMTEESARRRCCFGWGDASFLELLLYNMRHVQHGAAQLNLILRRAIDAAPPWIARATPEHRGP